MELSKLYPQYKNNDRRQQNIPVDNDRRSGIDRRTNSDSYLRQDLKQVKDTFAVFRTAEKAKLDYIHSKTNNNLFLKGIFSCVPALRRIDSIEDNRNDRLKAYGLGTLAIINLKEDFRDILSVVGLAKSEAPEGFKPVFKFFNGTIVENWLRKTQKGKKLLNNIDITLADTNFMKNYLENNNIEWQKRLYSKEIKYPLVKNPERVTREYIKYECGLNHQILLHSLNRITKLGLIFAGILEIPNIAKSIKQGHDYKQILKSAISVVSYASIGALCSATGAVFAGSAGSVLGLGFGFFVGNQLSRHINSKI